VNLQYSDPENRTGVIRTGLSVPYSAEFREMGTNFALLNEAVGKTKGRQLAMDPLKDKVFSRDLPPAVARQPMWRWIVQWLLLPLFLLDVAARRLASTIAMSVYVELAVFVMALAAMYQPGVSPMIVVYALIVAELVGWAIRWRSIGPTLAFFTGTVRGLSRAAQRSEQSLSRLKGVREKVREDMATPAEASEPEPKTIKLEPAPTRRGRKFDVGDEQAAKPAGDLTESLGGAQQVEPGQQPSQQTGPAPGSMADRLKRAKQRAQDQIRDQKDKEK
jgi:hypothetical protein